MVVGSPIVLNLIPGGVMPVMMINETDKGYKKEFLIYNGAAPYDLPANVSATIRGTKRDGYGVTEAAEVTSGSNLVRITVTEQMTAVPGPNIFELVFEDTNNLKVATINFIMMVERSALNANTVISDSDIAYAGQVLDRLQSVAAFKEQLDNASDDVDDLKNDINDEVTRAESAESSLQSAISAEASARQAADQTLQQNINAEASARQVADNQLQSNINAEASTRATQDASLQSQINQLIAPSGEAPSAAEVQNARIGSDGTVYPTLGDAIRTQNSLLKSALDYTNDVLKTGCFRIQNATINSSGVIVAQVSSDPQYQYDLLCYRVTADNPVSFSTLTNGVYAFFTDRPVLSAVSYNASRSNANANSQITANIPSGCNWIAIRVAHGGELATITMTPYVISYTNKKVYYITPEDFGAVGNGVANDTNAIQAMFDYIATIANNGVVVCNGKTGARYLVNTISISTDAYNYAHNISINNFQFGLINDLMFSASSNNHYGFHFNNCIFNAVQSNDPVWANNYVFTYATFRDCVFNSFKYIIYCDVFEQELTFEDCHFISCNTCFYGTAFFTLTCRHCIFDHCTHALEQKMLNENLAANLRIAQEICFDGCYFDYYQFFAIKLAAYSEVIVEKCYFEHGGLDTDGKTHINNRDGILIYDDAQYTRKKSILTVRDNHFQDTIDVTYSPKLVNATNSTFDTLIIKGNASYNTRFLSVEGANCTGVIEFFGNVLTSLLTPTPGNILGDFSAMKLIGYIDGTFYINGSPYGV